MPLAPRLNENAFPLGMPSRVRWLGVAALLAIVADGVSGADAVAMPDAAPTLEQCFRLALQRSDVIAGQVERIGQAEARIRQARAPFRPNLSVGAVRLRQEAPSSPFGQELFPADQTTVSATATQNILKGFRDLAALRQRELEHGAAELAREQAKVQLFRDTAQAFYNVLTYEDELLNYRREIEANEGRRRELQQLRRLARARTTEIAAIDAALANLHAAAANTRGLLDAARETLSFLTGLPADVALADSESYPTQLSELDPWLRGIDQKPNVRQLRREMEAAREGVAAAKAGRGPSVDVSANYYAERPGINADVDWDVQLSVKQPLYTGGLVQAQIGEAAAQRNAKALELEQARKEAERDIRSLHKTLQANLEQIDRLAAATDLTQRNYQLLLKDHRGGLATNLDVLQALANVYQTQRALGRARYAAKYNYAALQAIAARRNLSDADSDTPAESLPPR